jgi:hypothetical protein
VEEPECQDRDHPPEVSHAVSLACLMIPIPKAENKEDVVDVSEEVVEEVVEEPECQDRDHPPEVSHAVRVACLMIPISKVT